MTNQFVYNFEIEFEGRKLEKEEYEVFETKKNYKIIFTNPPEELLKIESVIVELI